jgi:hypothetical protein
MTFIKRTFAITLLINIIIAASSNAQPFTYNKKQFLLKRLHYQNSSGEKGVTTFIYDKENQLYKAVWELLDSSRYSFNYYKLNNENIVEVNRTFSDKMTSQKKITYNTQNQIIEEYFWRSDSVEGTAKYEYKNGKLSKLIANKMNGWFTGELHYEYENQMLKQARIFMKGENVGIVYYKFSNIGNLFEEKWQFGEKWSQTFTYEYVEKVCLNWVSSNPLIVIPCPYIVEKEDYDFNKETGGPSEFIYDKGGKLIEKIFTRSDGLKTKTTFEYDAERKLVKSYRNYSDSTKGIFSYYYNSNGQIIEKKFIKPDGFKSNESFAYDIHGNLRFARYDSMDSWLTGNIFFELDRYDRIKSAIFKADEGYIAKITFEYNSEDLITKIHWEFSFGKAQTYSFSYIKTP